MSLYNLVTCVASNFVDGDLTNRYEHTFTIRDGDSLPCFLRDLLSLFDNGSSTSSTFIEWRSNIVTIIHSWSDHEAKLRTDVTLHFPTSQWAIVKDLSGLCLVNDLVWRLVNHDCTFEVVEEFCDRAADVGNTCVYVYAGSGNDYLIL